MRRLSTFPVLEKEKALIVNPSISQLQRLIVSRVVNAIIDETYQRVRSVLELTSTTFTWKLNRVAGGARRLASSVLAWLPREERESVHTATRDRFITSSNHESEARRHLVDTLLV